MLLPSAYEGMLSRLACPPSRPPVLPNTLSPRHYPIAGTVGVGYARTIPTPIGGGSRLLLSPDIIALLAPFARLFSSRTWRPVAGLIVGAILTPGRRLVSSALRVVGVSHLRTFQSYHRVLNRAVWSSLGVSRILLGLLVTTFAPTGPLVVGIDETIERRRGPKIAAAAATAPSGTPARIICSICASFCSFQRSKACCSKARCVARMTSLPD